MSQIILINSVAVLFAIFVVIIPASKYSKKLNVLISSLDNKPENYVVLKELNQKNKMGVIISSAICLAFVPLAILIASSYTKLQEPTAVIGAQIAMYLIVFGIGFFTIYIGTICMIIVAVKSIITQNYLFNVSLKNSTVKSIQQELRVGRSKDIVIVTTVIGTIMAIASGAILIATLIAASGAAIDCARSSKCM